MYKTHTYKDPDQQPTLYEELEENEVYTPGYDQGVYKQITPYRLNDDSEQADLANQAPEMSSLETDEADRVEKEGEPVHGDRDSEGNIYQRDVGEYVSEEMFTYLNELVYGEEENNEHKIRLFLFLNFLKGEGGTLKQGIPFLTTEGGPEPTKFKAQHTCRPVNLDEFFPAATRIGAGVKPVKLRLPLAKAISKLTGAINEAEEGIFTVEESGKNTELLKNYIVLKRKRDSTKKRIRASWCNNNGKFLTANNKKGFYRAGDVYDIDYKYKKDTIYY